MTDVKSNVFVDRRSAEHVQGGLATQILFWYDNHTFRDRGGIERTNRRTNAMAVTTNGELIVARVSCYFKDQFEKSKGRMILEKQIFARAKNCSILPVFGASYNQGTISEELLPEYFARSFKDGFPEDETGFKRAFNAGKIYAGWLKNLKPSN